MLLTIDMGNTQISVGCFEGTDLKFSSSFPTKPNTPHSQTTNLLLESLQNQNISPDDITDVAIASVVPEALTGFVDAIKEVISENIWCLNANNF